MRSRVAHACGRKSSDQHGRGTTDDRCLRVGAGGGIADARGGPPFDQHRGRPATKQRTTGMGYIARAPCSALVKVSDTRSRGHDGLVDGHDGATDGDGSGGLQHRTGGAFYFKLRIRFKMQIVGIHAGLFRRLYGQI